MAFLEKASGQIGQNYQQMRRTYVLICNNCYLSLEIKRLFVCLFVCLLLLFDKRQNQGL